jgi:hypothetical protein
MAGTGLHDYFLSSNVRTSESDKLLREFPSDFGFLWMPAQAALLLLRRNSAG